MLTLLFHPNSVKIIKIKVTNQRTIWANHTKFAGRPIGDRPVEGRSMYITGVKVVA